MKTVFLFLLVGISLFSNLDAQTLKAFEKAGDKSMAMEDWAGARYYFEEALLVNDKKASLWFKFAEAARKQKALEEAKRGYEQVIALQKDEKFPLAPVRLAEILGTFGDYEACLATLQSSKALELIPEGELWKRHATWAMEQPMDSSIQIVHLSKRINSSYSDFAPFVQGDSLYYASYKFPLKNDTYDPPRRRTKLLLSKKEKRPRALTSKINDKSLHTAHLSINPSRNRIYITKCAFEENSLVVRCQLYVLERDKKRKRWGKPKKLSENINHANSHTTQPFATWDANEEKEVLYFVSDRKGGKGALDLWKAYRQEDGTFEDPINLEKLNTPFDEGSPYVDPFSGTFYFASKGHTGFGGWDVFSLQNQRIQNLGLPINSSYDDLYFTFGQDSTFGYFASNRPGSFYLNEEMKTCCFDIFKFEPVPPDPEDVQRPETVDSHQVVVNPPIPKPDPPVTFNVLEDFLPLSLYFDNDEPDKRSRRTSTKKSYPETFAPYYARKDIYLDEYLSPLKPEQREMAEEQIEFFFEQKVKRGHDLLEKFSELLLKRLKEGEEIEIFLKGFTSPRAKSDYNIQLGKRRISSVKNHFQQYKNGIFKPYLQAQQLIISERSFGETTADQSISDDLFDLRNSIYSVGAARERRVEIVEIIRK